MHNNPFSDIFPKGIDFEKEEKTRSIYGLFPKKKMYKDEYMQARKEHFKSMPIMKFIAYPGYAINEDSGSVCRTTFTSKDTEYIVIVNEDEVIKCTSIEQAEAEVKEQILDFEMAESDIEVFEVKRIMLKEVKVLLHDQIIS